jgi:hypothetical protein
MHAQTYEVEVEGFGKESDAGLTNAIRVRADYDTDRQGFRIVVTEVSPIPDLWSLLLGDIVHDFRCALDHIAWTIYQLGPKVGTLPEHGERSIQFPIARTVDWFDNNIDRMIPGISPTQKAIVRSHQPQMHPPAAVSTHSLEILWEFSNADKHRAIQPLLMWPTDCTYQITDSRDCDIPGLGRHALAHAIEVDTEIGFIDAVATGPDPQAEVEVSLAAQPLILANVSVIEWLDETRPYIATLLGKFGMAPRDALVSIGVPANLIP